MLKTLTRQPKQRGATLLTPKQYEQRVRVIPESWRKAAGMLKGKFTEDPVAWQRRIRQESDDRLARQIKLGTSGHR